MSAGPPALFGGFVHDFTGVPIETNPTGPQTLEPQIPASPVDPERPFQSVNGLVNIGVDPIGAQAYTQPLPVPSPPAPLLAPGFYVIDADPTGAPQAIPQPQAPTPPNLAGGIGFSTLTDPQGPQSYRQV